MCRTCEDSHLNVEIPFVGMSSIPTSQSYFWLLLKAFVPQHMDWSQCMNTELVEPSTHTTLCYQDCSNISSCKGLDPTFSQCLSVLLPLCVRPWSSSPASPEDFKLGRVALAGPEKKPERDSRGHGYSWRDLVQRICNLHFKHTLKSVPGRQPRSALTLVAGGAPLV